MPTADNHMPPAPASRRLMLLGLCLLWLALVGMSHCEPAWKKSLRITPPKGSRQKQMRWFRRTFYRLSQEERQAQDGGDRVRRFVRQWRKIGRLTYLNNQARLRARRREGLSFDRLDRFYLIMNAFMRATLPKASLPPLRLNQPKPPEKPKEDTLSSSP